MGLLGESVNYIIFTNPVSAEVGKMLKKSGLVQPKAEPSTVNVYHYEPLYKLARSSGPFVRLAGVMGASAVILGAYGAHKTYPEENENELKRIYETANRLHFIHTLALLGSPLCRKPAISGAFFVLGMVLFCGSCYHTAFTGQNTLRRFAPIGGTCFIIGWLTMVI